MVNGGVKTRRQQRMRDSLTFRTSNLYESYRGIHKADAKLVDSVKFKDILSDFNQEIQLNIIEGNPFDMGYGLGFLTLGKIKRRVAIGADGQVRLPVAWNKSMIRKKELLAEGKIPFKAIRDEEMNVIGDNGGEKWFVHHDDPWYIRWFWDRISFTVREGGQKKKVLASPNMRFYQFIPCVKMKWLIGQVTPEVRNFKLRECYPNIGKK